ncbi:hypothetical protein V8G54_023843, partial [Vigna mungo]
MEVGSNNDPMKLSCREQCGISCLESSLPYPLCFGLCIAKCPKDHTTDCVTACGFNKSITINLDDRGVVTKAVDSCLQQCQHNQYCIHQRAQLQNARPQCCFDPQKAWVALTSAGRCHHNVLCLVFLFFVLIFTSLRDSLTVSGRQTLNLSASYPLRHLRLSAAIEDGGGAKDGGEGEGEKYNNRDEDGEDDDGYQEYEVENSESLLKEQSLIHSMENLA